jgi:RNA polymerase sigma-70 factor (ECF subfamily)
VNADQYKDITDNELLEKFYRDKDNRWLGILLQRYTMLLFGVCMKYLKNEDDAKDSVQQVFLKIIAELHKYRVDYFKSWIYMIAKNHCLMRLRDRQGKTPVELKEQSMGLEEEAAGPDSYRGQQHIEKDRMLDLMSVALEELNKEQKLCVTLFYLDKKSYQEIADKTGYSMGQVKSYIQNGKRNLKLLMERKLSEQ